MIDRLFAIFSGLVTRIHEEVCSQQPFYLPYTLRRLVILKTQAGIRTFPIHPLLLSLGFAGYIDELRGSEHDRVLHGIPLGNRKAGDQAGKWWNERYREKHLHGFKEQRKTLYSFRHTFATNALNEAGIELALVQQAVGRERSQR